VPCSIFKLKDSPFSCFLLQTFRSKTLSTRKNLGALSAAIENMAGCKETFALFVDLDLKKEWKMVRSVENTSLKSADLQDTVVGTI